MDPSIWTWLRRYCWGHLPMGTAIPILGDYFGRRDIGTIMGMLQLLTISGAMAEPVAAGWGFDSYSSCREPGDSVEIRDGKVFVNDIAIQESYVAGLPNCSLPKNCQTRLKDREYFVLGDNRVASNNSHHWGPVHLDNIGRVWVSYWPFLS